MTTLSFNTGAVAPIEALNEAWRRVRDVYWLFLGITVAGMVLASVVPMALLMGPMMCGIFGCYRARQLGDPVRFEMVFDGFKQPVLLESILATLVLVGASMVITLPFTLICVVLLAVLGVLSPHHHHSGPPPALFFVGGGA